MKHDQTKRYFCAAQCLVDDLAAVCDRTLGYHEVPLAAHIENNIPIYKPAELELNNDHSRQKIMREWAQNLHLGSGIVVLRAAQPDSEIIDAASDIFLALLEQEQDLNGDAADHFANAGSNGRIWNSLQKLCQQSPEQFVHYHGLPVIDAMAQAWLGPNYQMTAQVNLVPPGGAAQAPHRDYHLGFMTQATAERFPGLAHQLSPALTLQGAIAHVDIEIDAGPTKLLPFSQHYPAGYVAWQQPQFKDYFEENFVQLALNKGDALFFNPAVFHAGGENRTDHVQRLVNLLQISSAMGRAMESIDRQLMCRLVYPELLHKNHSDEMAQATIAACAEGYAFPTNLNNDPPTDGLSPTSQADLMRIALAMRLSADEFNQSMDALLRRQQA